MTKKHIRRVALALLLAVTTAAFAQEAEDEEIFVPTNSLGDQTLGINLGPFIPLFIAGGGDVVPWGNLTLGGVGSLAWGSYITNEFKLGVELGGSFSFTPNRRTLFIVPLVVNASYIFQAYPFDFPVSVSLGTSFSRIDEYLKVDPFVKAGGSFYWNYSTQWAFGANLQYWFIPQIYVERHEAPVDETRLGNFLELSFSALYHF